MRRIVVHIGHPKTGTTALQSSLGVSREALLEHGVLFPRILRVRNHRASKVRFAGIRAAHTSDLRKHGGDVDAVLEEASRSWELVCEDIALHKPDVTVLSSESFFSFGTHGGLDIFANELAGFADEVVFVAYLRAPAPLLLSRLQQRLKHHGMLDPPAELQYYQSQLTPFLELDQCQLRVHCFDRNALIGGDIISDFATRYLPKNAAAVLQRPTDDQNASMSPEAMAVLEDAHTGTIGVPGHGTGEVPRKLWRTVRRLDEKVPGKSRPRYKPGIARLVHDLSTDLDWLQQTFGISFDAPEPHPAAQNVSPIDLTHVRAYCHVDEERYARIRKRALRSLQKPEKDKPA